MSRSLRVHENCLNRVKLALPRNGFPSQRSLAEDAGLALATVSNFLTGKPVDFTTFEELCRRLALDWREIANLDFEALSHRKNPKPEAIKLDESNPNTSPTYPSGAVAIGSPFYLERTFVETQIKQEISKPGALVRIKAPREMGKTSLMLRILEHAQQLGYCTVSLNLEQVDQAILADLSKFLRWLCANITRQLQLKLTLDEYWDEDLGSKISCTSYFEDYLLESITTPLVLALDEVHQIFEHPEVAKDFLPLLRSWYEEAKTLPIWQKLRLLVVHSTEIYVPLQLNQSPFNVGLPVQLETFSLAEIQQLTRRYGLDWETEEQAKQLMQLVGGHPALTHLAIYHLSCGEINLEQLLETSATLTGIFSHHLQRCMIALEEQPELASIFNAVIAATEPVQLDQISAYKLRSLGLINQSADSVSISCELYRQYYGNEASSSRENPVIITD